jgi:diguanylate cyclase (GGDEF)-like protein
MAEKSIGGKNCRLRKEFRNKMVCDHSKWLVILMVLGVASQVILFLLDLSSLSILNGADIFIRTLIIVFCIVFAVLITLLLKQVMKGKNALALIIVKGAAQAFILTVGAYITVTLFSQGTYSFTPFVITALIISFTNVHWPYLFNAFIALAFSALTFYIRDAFPVPEYYAHEAHMTIMLIVLIGIAELLIYNKHWQVFLSENKITDMNKQLVNASQIDQMTGIFNRQMLENKLSSLIENAKCTGVQFSVVMIDLDHFKAVNDNYGHILGDEVLKHFSMLVKENLRKEDIFGRWGGEEFLIIIPGSCKETALKFVERIRKLVAEHDFAGVGKITFSAGISEFVPDCTDDKLIGNADFALYISKNLGRNQVHVY